MEQNRFEPPGSAPEAPPRGATQPGSSSSALVSGGGLPAGPQPLESEGRRAAGVVADKLKERVAHTVDERKAHASGSLQQIAQALHDVSRSLEQNGLAGVSHVSDRAAEQMERTADYLRRRDLDGLLRDTRDVARRHPEIFVGGALLAGILLGRFLRSSTPAEESHDLAFDDELGLDPQFGPGSYSEPSSGSLPPGGWA